MCHARRVAALAAAFVALIAAPAAYAAPSTHRVDGARTQARRPAVARASGFPAADSAYHDYAEMQAEIDARIAAAPAIARRYIIGTSYEGRQISAIKISDNVGADEA